MVKVFDGNIYGKTDRNGKEFLALYQTLPCGTTISINVFLPPVDDNEEYVGAGRIIIRATEPNVELDAADCRPPQKV